MPNHKILSKDHNIRTYEYTNCAKKSLSSPLIIKQNYRNSQQCNVGRASVGNSTMVVK